MLHLKINNYAHMIEHCSPFFALAKSQVKATGAFQELKWGPHLLSHYHRSFSKHCLLKVPFNQSIPTLPTEIPPTSHNELLIPDRGKAGWEGRDLEGQCAPHFWWNSTDPYAGTNIMAGEAS